MALAYHRRRVAFPPLSGTCLAPVLADLVAVDEVVAPGAITPPRPAGHLIIWYTRSGRAAMPAGAGLLEHAPRMLAAVSPGTVIANRDNPVPWDVTYLLVAGPWAAAAASALDVRGGVVTCPQAPAVQARALLDCVSLALDQPSGWTWRLAAALAPLLAWIEGAADVGDDLARLARELDATPDSPWRTATLAASLGIAPRTLQRRFREAGLPAPDAWARRRRLDHARLLLRQGLAVAAVAQATGFANAFHFSRSFVRRFGHPPSHEQPPG